MIVNEITENSVVCVCVFEGELKEIFDVKKQLSYL